MPRKTVRYLITMGVEMPMEACDGCAGQALGQRLTQMFTEGVLELDDTQNCALMDLETHFTLQPVEAQTVGLVFPPGHTMTGGLVN